MTEIFEVKEFERSWGAMARKYQPHPPRPLNPKTPPPHMDKAEMERHGEDMENLSSRMKAINNHDIEEIIDGIDGKSSLDTLRIKTWQGISSYLPPLRFGTGVAPL